MIRQRGFTFVELVISLVVIGIATVGVLLVFTTTVSRSADPLVREQGLAVAQGYLDEVISKSYTDPDGIDGEGARASYDDIDDYTTIVAAAPALPDGTAIAELNDYAVTVTVAAPQVINGVTVRLVTVDVSHPSGLDVSLWSYRAQY